MCDQKNMNDTIFTFLNLFAENGEDVYFIVFLL